MGDVQRLKFIKWGGARLVVYYGKEFLGIKVFGRCRWRNLEDDYFIRISKCVAAMIKTI